MRSWVRGCFLFLYCFVSAAFAQDVPSGQSVALHDVRVDDMGTEVWVRFRFLAPAIGRTQAQVTYAQVEADFVALCETVVRPYLAGQRLRPDGVVISLMDRPVPFGQADPDATQFFEAFRITADMCVWQGL